MAQGDRKAIIYGELRKNGGGQEIPFISYHDEQTLTEAEKANVRKKIGADVANAMYAGVTNSGDTAGWWHTTISGITELYEGLTIKVRLSTTYNSTANTLNVNNLGDKLICYRRNTVLTNHIPQYGEIMLTYRADAHSGYTPSQNINALQSGVTYKDGWMLEYQYNDGNNYERYLSQYEKRYAGDRITRYQILGLDNHGRIHPLTPIPSGSYNTGTTKNPTRVGLNPNRFFYYNSTSIIAANAATSSVLYESYPITNAKYTFNSDLPTYHDVYLAGELRLDGLFHLDTTSTTSWYVYVPNSANTYSLKNYFTPGKDYLYLGASYSSQNYMQLSPTHYVLRANEYAEIIQTVGNANMLGGKSLAEIEGEIDRKVTALTNINYSGLKNLKDNGGLIPGMQYRICDYVTITKYDSATSGKEYESARHPFDIIVTADDSTTLNENARAILHSGDTYFANSKLESWELKYCFDNDAERFDIISQQGESITKITANGSIYEKYGQHMLGAWQWMLVGGGGSVFTDSENPQVGDLCSNQGPTGARTIPITAVEAGSAPTAAKGVIYYMKDEFGNECPYDFKNIMFYRKWNSSTGTWSTITGSSQTNVTAPCYTFSSNGTSTTFSYTDSSLQKNALVYGNVIKEAIVAGKLILNNICLFGTNSYGNVFGHDCWNNTLGNGCRINLYDSVCQNNTLGDSCANNTFGIGCTDNSIGTNCLHNTFGSHCNHNKFAANTGGTIGNYFCDNIIENGVEYFILFNGATSSAQQVRKYHIKSSIVGTSSSPVKISATTNNTVDKTVAFNSSNMLKTYCEADLVP